MRISDWSSDVCSSDLVCPRLEIQARIRSRKLVKTLCTQQYSYRCQASIYRFPGVGDRSRFNQAHDTVAEHAGMNAEVAAVCEPAQNRIWHGPYSHLQHAAILDESSSVFSDTLLDLAHNRHWRFQQRSRTMHNGIEMDLFQPMGAIGPWHLLVDFSDDHARAPRRA